MPEPAAAPNGRTSAPYQRPYRTALAGTLLAVVVTLFVRCAGAPPVEPPRPSDHDATPTAAATPDWIVIAGERFPIGTRVVTWTEPTGYSAYRRGKHFDRSEPADGKARYSARGNLAPADSPHGGPTLPDLQRSVHQFVVHYDMAGCARQCFKVLQDVRTLSVHFLLDLDGTIYQTLDLREKGWHATIANDWSVGIEIAHPGAWRQPLNADMRRWYERDALGWRQRFPAWMKETGLPDGFVARPARPEFVTGIAQGRTYHQFDFTPQQYEALAHLMAGLNRALPRIRLEAPRGADGEVLAGVLSPEELAAFDGVVGHLHVQGNKVDPGPAFQWQSVLQRARELRRDR